MNKSNLDNVKDALDGKYEKKWKRSYYMGSVKEEDKSKREKSLLEKYSREELGLMPLFCPKCSKMMKGKLDKKMWPLHRMCFDCVVKMETKMRAEGTYKEYERNKIEANMKSYLRDAKQQSEEYLKSLEQIEILQNSQGDIEKWELGSEAIEEIKKRHKKQLDEIQSLIDKIEKEK